MTTTGHKKFNLLLFTIGHSNHSFEDFLKLLKVHGISCLVDVRSVPYNAYHKKFSKENLLYELRQQKIDYRWMGDSLGGKREELTNSAGIRMDDSFYTDYNYLSGIIDLMRIALKERTAIMCSEEDPRNCHRHKIIAKTLLRRIVPECHKLNDISVLHIRGDGHTENAATITVAVQKALPF